jgi:ribonuclease HII
MRRATAPGWAHERRAGREGCRTIAGLDEVGRGSLAGPVIVAAVILDPARAPQGIRDSKLLTPSRRAGLLRAILRSAEAWSIGACDVPEIDAINILNATKKAMTRAIETLAIRPDHLLIDALTLPEMGIPQTPITRGDRVCMSIAAASIVAKVVRDRVMDHYDRLFPQFGFAANKGYGTRGHLEAVERHGACAIHRSSFKGVWRDGVLPFDGDGAVPMIAG